ncbi:MAG: NAD(P)-dependent oxidoreductase [Armatimonadota bacterium]
MIAVTEISGWEQDFFAEQAALAGQEVLFYEGTADDIPPGERERLEILSCFIRSQIDPEFLEQCPNLKLIATRSTGFDHIDLAWCASHGVAVANVPVYGENTVAEHTFGLILALSRHIYDAADRVKRGSFEIEGLLGFDLNGKTLGVIGAGKIGLHVIRMGVAMNMRVKAFDTQPHGILAEVLNFEYCPLDELLREADVVTLHVPLNRHTRHLLNAEKLDLMKQGSILVNTSRGAVVDSAALLRKLNEGHLAGAALDVLEGEEVITEDTVLLREETEGAMDKLRLAVEAYQLMHHPRVLVTPHMAFYSREALQRIILTTVQNIAASQAGQPHNLVEVAPG